MLQVQWTYFSLTLRTNSAIWAEANAVVVESLQKAETKRDAFKLKVQILAEATFALLVRKVSFK